MDNFDFGDWLFDEMERQEVSRQELSRRTGISNQNIGYYLDGSRSPRLQTFGLILKALGKEITIT